MKIVSKWEDEYELNYLKLRAASIEFGHKSLFFPSNLWFSDLKEIEIDCNKIIVRHNHTYDRRTAIFWIIS